MICTYHEMMTLTHGEGSDLYIPWEFSNAWICLFCCSNLDINCRRLLFKRAIVFSNRVILSTELSVLFNKKRLELLAITMEIIILITNRILTKLKSIFSVKYGGDLVSYLYRDNRKVNGYKLKVTRQGIFAWFEKAFLNHKHSRKSIKIQKSTGFVTWSVTRWVSLMEQELPTLPEHLSLPPVLMSLCCSIFSFGSVLNLWLN